MPINLIESNSPKKEPKGSLIKFNSFLNFCYLLSFVSICLNTPINYCKWPKLIYITFTIDSIVTLIFAIDLYQAYSKIGHILKKLNKFDLFLLVVHILSLITHIFEMINFECTKKDEYIVALRWCRVFRPLISFKLFNCIFNIQVTNEQFQMIYAKVENQLYNVVYFFLFISTFFSILGIQIFSKPDHRCFTSPNITNLAIRDLSVPDSLCSTNPNYGNQCPKNMYCVQVSRIENIILEYQYNNLINAFFTVYKAASQEEWTTLMYEKLDQMPAYEPILFYISLTFFLSWLVKNLFIAVVTQSFELIRAHHFQDFWSPSSTKSDVVTEVLNNSFQIDRNWNLVRQHESEYKRHYIFEKLNQLFQSRYYNYLVLAQILVESIVIASIDFKDTTDKDYLIEWHKKYFHFYAEIILTFLFIFDVLLKMLTYGHKNYLRESIHKFELALAIGCLINLIPTVNKMAYFISFKVLRILRLIRVSPLLENFIYRIFGSTKKLGVIVIFTAIVLIILSAISLQLFCTIELYSDFSTFTYSFISIFSVFTQEGWIKLMDTTKSKVDNPFLSLLISIYFLIIHLLLSLVVLSLFVAVILDNLSDPEKFKKVLQDNMRKQIEYKENTKLPYRLRFYKLFKEQPKLIKLKKTSGQFETPKITSSFIKEFVLNPTETELELNRIFKQQITKVGQHFSVYNMNEMTICEQLDEKLDQNLKQCWREQTEVESLKLISNCHTSKNRLRRHQDKLIQVDQLLKISECKSKEDEMDDEFSKQIEILGDRWRELPSTTCQLTASGRRKSIRFDESALNDKNDQQLLGGKYEVKQRATSKALEVLKHYLDQRSSNSVKNRLKILEENHPLLNRSLFFIKKSNWFRRRCVELVEYKFNLRTFLELKQFDKLNTLIYSLPVVDWAMILLTLISCSTLIFENPNYSILNSPKIIMVECLFISTLFIDLAVKLVAFGFFTPDSYLFNPWFLIDLIVLINSTVLILFKQFGVEIPLIILILRCLRPLRFFSLIPNMKKVTNELLKGFREYVLVFFILFFFLFIFATFALLLFGGKLKRCNDSDRKADACYGLIMKTIKVTNLRFKTAEQDLRPFRILVPTHRSNPRNFKFDDIYSSMLALFEMLSLEGYTEVIEIVSQQVGFYSPLFIIFYLFFGMIIITLFVGVVIENYNRNNGTGMLTVDQRNYKDLKKRLKMVKPLDFPPRPKNLKLSQLYDLVFSQKYVNFTIFTIIFNTLLFSSPIEMEHLFTPYIRFASYFLNTFFISETIFKLCIYNLKDFLRSRLYCLELFISFISLVYIILKFVFYLVNIDFHEYFIKLVILVNILRFLTLAGKHPVLRMLVLTVYTSFYKSFFILFAQFIFVLVYAIAGVYLFANVKYGESLSRHANFKTPLFGMLTLFRVMTGEDWNKLLHDAMISWPHCTPGGRSSQWNGDCGHTVYSLIYFSSFYIIITYITLNLLVAVILEQFSLFYSTNEEDLISHDDIVHLQETWALVNKYRKEKIDLNQFKFFLRLLNGKFRMDWNKQNFLFKCIVFEVGKYYNQNGINFQDVLQVISYRYVDCKRFLEPDEFVEREDLEYSIIEEVAKQTIHRWLCKCIFALKQKKELEEKENKWKTLKNRFKSAKIKRVTNVNFGKRNKTLEEDYNSNYKNFEIIVTDESARDSDDGVDVLEEIEQDQNTGEYLYASMLRPQIDEVSDWFDQEIGGLDYNRFD